MCVLLRDIICGILENSRVTQDETFRKESIFFEKSSLLSTKFKFLNCIFRIGQLRRIVSFAIK